MFVAPEGRTFWARDYSGIEAVLVGVFANAPNYIRLAQIDVHSFFTAWKLYELDKAIPYTEVPQLAWSDDQLRTSLASIKKRFKDQRQALKHVGHLTNYMGGAYKTQEVLLKELGRSFPIRDIQRMIDVYQAIFPDIPRWHSALCQQVDSLRRQPDPQTGRTGVCWVKNPFGFVMRFHNVLDWTKVGAEWTWEYGKDAKALVASLPQSTAAFIYCEAALTLDAERPDVSETLRLLIHDELLGECRKEQVEECLMVSKEIMERPIPQIPLPLSWSLGDQLRVWTEGKTGDCWGSMKSCA